MTRIIEAITRTGIRSSPSQMRVQRPHPGDHVRWADGKLGRIWTVGTGLVETDEAHACVEQGSVFLLDNGHVDISGGPFQVVKLADLEFRYELHLGRFWNWGDNLAGADMGCDFFLPRPVFAHPATP